jgi:uncharacterized protein YkwD
MSTTCRTGLMLTFFLSVALLAHGQAVRTPSLPEVKERIVTATNAFRKEEGKSPLRISRELDAAAEYFAGFMARTDKYGHEADDQKPAERATKHGYEYCIILENIAYQFSSAGFPTAELAERFVQGWKDSPGHRKNMLDADATEIGVAVAQSKETKRYYAVQLFGRPKSAEIVFKLTNPGDKSVRYQVDGEERTLEASYTVTHHRCRPPEVTFLPDAKQDKAAASEAKKIRPQHGEQYIVQASKDGGVRVEKK